MKYADWLAQWNAMTQAERNVAMGLPPDTPLGRARHNTVYRRPVAKRRAGGERLQTQVAPHYAEQPVRRRKPKPKPSQRPELRRYRGETPAAKIDAANAKAAKGLTPDEIVKRRARSYLPDLLAAGIDKEEAMRMALEMAK